ncbi:MAG: hypothetical protein M1835_000167 [Candelina submexicana]|nr:MAG: hypothetical protein M1835_000167 [Candelina submexicana]
MPSRPVRSAATGQNPMLIRIEALIRHGRNLRVPSHVLETLEDDMYTQYDLALAQANAQENEQIQREWDADLSARFMRAAGIPRDPDQEAREAAAEGRLVRYEANERRRRAEEHRQAQSRAREDQIARLRSLVLGTPAPRPRRPQNYGREPGYRAFDRLNARLNRAIALRDHEEQRRTETEIFALREYLQPQTQIFHQAEEENRRRELQRAREDSGNEPPLRPGIVRTRVPAEFSERLREDNPRPQAISRRQAELQRAREDSGNDPQARPEIVRSGFPAWFLERLREDNPRPQAISRRQAELQRAREDSGNDPHARPENVRTRVPEGFFERLIVENPRPQAISRRQAEMSGHQNPSPLSTARDGPRAATVQGREHQGAGEQRHLQQLISAERQARELRSRRAAIEERERSRQDQEDEALLSQAGGAEILIARSFARMERYIAGMEEISASMGRESGAYFSLLEARGIRTSGQRTSTPQNEMNQQQHDIVISRSAPGHTLQLPRRTEKEEFNLDLDYEIEQQNFWREARQWTEEHQNCARAAGDLVAVERFEQMLRSQETALRRPDQLTHAQRRNQRQSEELAWLRATRDYQILAASFEPYEPAKDDRVIPDSEDEGSDLSSDADTQSEEPPWAQSPRGDELEESDSSDGEDTNPNRSVPVLGMFLSRVFSHLNSDGDAQANSTRVNSIQHSRNQALTVEAFPPLDEESTRSFVSLFRPDELGGIPPNADENETSESDRASGSTSSTDSDSYEEEASPGPGSPPASPRDG